MFKTRLTYAGRALLENPDNDNSDMYEIRRIVYGSENFSEDDIRVIKDAIMRNKYWGSYHNIISNTNDPRLLIPFLDDHDLYGDDLARVLYDAILYYRFEKARILIEYGADIEASRAYVEIDQRERYEDNLREVIPPAVKSANKV
jgi:hypothetical protein